MGFHVNFFSDVSDCFSFLESNISRDNIVLISTKLDEEYKNVLKGVSSIDTSIVSIVYTASGTSRDVVLAIEQGAFDFVVIDYSYQQLIDSIKYAVNSFLAIEENEYESLCFKEKNFHFMFNDIFDHNCNGVSKTTLLKIKQKLDVWVASEKKDMEDVSILIVEDEFVYLHFLKDMLSSYYTVECASNGEEAIGFFENRQFDIVLLDLFLPDMPGKDVLKTIKLHNSQCQVVVITAFDFAEQASDVVKAGVAAYLNKPILKEDLLNTVQKTVLNYKNEFVLKKAMKEFFSNELLLEEKLVLMECLYEYKSSRNEMFVIEDLYSFFPKLKEKNIPDKFAFPHEVTRKNLDMFIKHNDA